MKCLATRCSAALVLLVCLSSALAQQPPAAHSLVVIDLRPKEEKQGSGLAPLTGNCNEDVYRVADPASNPPKITALQAELVG